MLIMTQRDDTTDSRTQKAAGDPAKVAPVPQDDDCTHHYHSEEYRLNGESVPSAGWRAVYAAMGVAER